MSYGGSSDGGGKKKKAVTIMTIEEEEALINQINEIRERIRRGETEAQMKAKMHAADESDQSSYEGNHKALENVASA
jgi:hypothetical protein